MPAACYRSPVRLRSFAIVDASVYKRLCRARDFIAGVYQEHITLADMAAAAGLSPYHFLRLFRRTMGETPHAYLTRVRLDHAKRVLARGASVTEVCFDVGFSSIGSFSALFAREVGLPPSAYARKMRLFAQVPFGLARSFVPFCFVERYVGT
jgi:AraC-like DNA-binding protein